MGKTEERIKEGFKLKKEKEEKNYLERDEYRAEQYKKAKKIIDEYHQWFINEKLKSFEFKNEDLKNFETIYFKRKNDKKNKKEKEELNKIQNKLRKKVSDAKEGIFNKKEDSPFEEKFIDGKKGKESILITWLKEKYDFKNIEEKKSNGEGLKEEEQKQEKELQEKIKIIREFKGWTTYFEGFKENRKNIYTEKERSTSIGYRLIHENLPKFLENKKCYENAKELKIDFSKINKEQILKNKNLDEIFSLTNFNHCLTQSGIDDYNLVLGGKTLKNFRG